MSIPIARPAIGDDEIRNVTEAIRGGWISGRGDFVERLESGFARHAGVAHGVAVSSGTAAVHVALAALGIGPGDEVIVPALTYVAPATVVRTAGARPVLVDVDASWNVDPAAVAAAITPRTKAVIAVHLYGRPCDVAALAAAAAPHGVPVVEDFSQAIGARVAGRAAGAHGRVSCASLYANKVVAAGEGGILLTDDAGLARQARRLRDQAMAEAPYYFHDAVGFSYRLSNLAAAVGVAQLERIEDLLAARRAIHAGYAERLAGVAALEPRPDAAPDVDEVCWLHSLLLAPDAPLARDALRDALAADGIETRPFFVSLDRLPIFPDAAPCPVAGDLCERGLSLPTFVGLGDDELDRVAAALRRALGA